MQTVWDINPLGNMYSKDFFINRRGLFCILGTILSQNILSNTQGTDTFN